MQLQAAYAEAVAQARFLLRPRWLLSHLLVVVLVVAMVNLGFWQLRRLDQRRDRNQLIETHQSDPVVAVDELLATADGVDAVEAVRFRRVTARGSYDAAATIEVRNRTLDGVPGVWVVTPLQLDEDAQVGIVRGFVALGSDGTADVPAPPGGEVTVTGTLVSPEGFDGTAPRDVRPLLDDPTMLQGVVLAEASEPPEPAAADSEQPAGAAFDDAVTTLHPVPLPELSEGPHLSYAAQWFIFSAIAVVGYPLVLRRVVQRRGREVDDVDAKDDEAFSPPDDDAADDLDRELEEILRRGS